MGTILHIKSMVCVRCIMAVQAVLQANHIGWECIELGRAELVEDLTPAQQAAVTEGLTHYELELVTDKKQVLIEGIKAEIIRLLHTPDQLRLKLSAHLSELFKYNYTYLSNRFSENEGISLERYFITQRIERVKELMVYDDLALTDIADEMKYSSVAHLSQQFKKVTGDTPAVFKKSSRSAGFVWRPLNAG